MAIYVELIKSDLVKMNFIYYNYQFSLPCEPYKNKAGKTRYKLKLVRGLIRIDKRNGKIYVVEFAEGDKGLYAQRATAVLRKCWEKKEFPDKTCWAS